MLRLVIQVITVCVIASTLGTVSGQDFPSKPIRIVAGSIGGTGDFVARQIGQGISGPLGQPVTIDNRGSGVAAGLAVAKAPPDGYTLLLHGVSFWTAPLLGNVPYDPIADFSPISLTVTAPSLLLVHPSVPAKSVKELIAYAKTKPGVLNYSSSAVGGAAHLYGELFNALAGVNTVHVPYKSSSQRLTDLLSGQVQMTFDGVSAALTEHIKSGKLRALAVTTPEPSALLPGVPTVAATLPGYDATSRQGIFAPDKTPEAVIRRLNQEIVRFLNQSDAKARFLDNGVEAAGSSPGEFAAAINAEIERLGKLIKTLGIKAE